MQTQLKIDPEFEAICPPLSEEEFELLEESILSEGVVLTPLVVWNDILLDGHNRYRILSRHPEIRYQLYQKSFSDRYEAKAWICKHQLGRRNLSPQQKKYLIALQYESEKMTGSFHGNRHTKLANPSDDTFHHHKNSTTRARIAAEHGVSEAYVQHAADYAKGVDAAEEIQPGIKSKLFSGELKPTETEVISIGKARLEERSAILEKWQSPKSSRKPYPTREERKTKKDGEARIEEVYSQMLAPHERVSDESILESLQTVGATLIHTTQAIFENFPDFINDADNKKRVIGVLQEAKNYIIRLEEDWCK